MWEQDGCSDPECDALHARRGAARRQLLCLHGDTAEHLESVFVNLLSESHVPVTHVQPQLCN